MRGSVQEQRCSKVEERKSLLAKRTLASSLMELALAAISSESAAAIGYKVAKMGGREGRRKREKRFDLSFDFF